MNLLAYLYKFIAIFFNPAERAKLKLKAIVGNEIKKNRYHKFYNIRTKEAMPVMGLFFRDTYCCVQNYQKPLMNAEKSQVLKDIIFEHYIDNKGKELIYHLSEDYIRSQCGIYDIEELEKEVKNNIDEIKKHFGESFCVRINNTYKKIIFFTWLVNFDYLSILKKFAGVLGSINVTETQFNKIKCSYILNYIKDFLSITSIVKSNSDWQELFDILKKYDNVFLESEKWIKLYPSFTKVIKSQIFTLIIRHNESDPDWTYEPLEYENNFAYDYIASLINKCHSSLENVEKEIKSGMIEKLVSHIFLDGISRHSANFYNDVENETYILEGYGGFTMTKQFCYLFSFFCTYYENIKEIINIIIIKGSWVSRDYSSEMSQLTLNLNDRFQELLTFDKSLSDQGERGLKLKSYCSKASISKRHKDTLCKFFDTINVEASDLIRRTMYNLTLFHKQLNALENERSSHQQGVIKNWKELDHLLKDCMPFAECVQKLNDIIELIHYIEGN